MALIGQHAPLFTMPQVTPGHVVNLVSLADYRGRWLILFFYPHDFTFVCPTEITAFSTAYADFAAERADILGVSTDSPAVHQAWLRTPPAEGGLGPLKFSLASDRTHEVARAYGVYCAEEGAAYRGLFIISPEGVVEYEVVHNLNVGRSVPEVLRVLQAIQAGGLCPVNWNPGESLISAP